MARTAEAICVCIKDYYDSLGVKNIDKLDGDQTLSIFMYLVAKANIKTLPSQCDMMLNFTTNNLLNSITGYYVTTLEACLTCMISMGNKPKRPADIGREGKIGV